MSITVNNNDRSTDLKLIRCCIQNEDLIEALDKLTYDENYSERQLVEVALGKLLEDEGYL